MEVNEAYNMLLGHPWLIDAKVTCDLGNKVVTLQGNGTMKTILVNQRIRPRLKLPEVLVCNNIIEGLIDKKEDWFFSIEEDLFAIGTITLPRNLVGARSKGADPSSYSKHFSTYMEGDITVDETPIKTKVQEMRITTWTLLEVEQVQLLNVEIETKPAYLKVNTHLDQALAQEAKSSFGSTRVQSYWKDPKKESNHVKLHFELFQTIHFRRCITKFSCLESFSTSICP